MPDMLRVLILEDRPADAELLVSELRRAGYDPRWLRVATEAEYLASLEPGIDVILADYAQPQYDALSALRTLRERGLDIPLIVITGALSDEVAVECIKQGASDYLLKDRLARLGPAVARALEEKQQRDKARTAETAMRAVGDFRGAIERCMQAGLAAVDQYSAQTYVTPAFCRMVGWSEGELLGATPPFVYWPPEEMESITREFRKAVAGQSLPGVELRFRRSNGERFDALVLVSPLKDSSSAVVGALASVLDITPQRQTENQLRESEERYRALAEAAHDAIFILGGGGQIIYVNGFAARGHSKRPEDLVGKRLDEVFPQDHARVQKRNVDMVFRTGEPLYVERETPYPDRTVWLGTWLVPLKNAKGAVHSVMGVARDISYTKQTEKTLRTRFQEVEALLRVSRAAATSIGLKPVAQEALAAAVEALKLDGAVIRYLEKRTGDLVLLAHASMPAAIVQDLSSRPHLKPGEGMSSIVARTGEPVVVTNAKRDPRVAYLSLLGSEFQSFVGIPLKVQHEVVGVISGFCEKERTLTQRELDLATSIGNIVGMAIANARLFEQAEASAQEWERTFHGMSDGMFLLGTDHRIIRANRALARMLGTTPEALVGQLCHRAVHGLDSPIPDCVGERCMAEKRPCELVRQEHNLGDRWLSVTAEPMVDSHGKVVTIIHSVKDVTEHRRVQAELDLTEHRYRSLVEAAGARIVRVDRKRKRTFVAGAESAARPPVRDTSSTEFGSHVHPEDRDSFFATLQQVFDTGQPAYGRVNRTLFRGQVHHMSVNWEPIRDAQGNVGEVQLTGFDVTQQKLLEAQYFQAQKMESVGRLAGGVAHDFNNLLTAILGYSEMGLASLPVDSPVRAHLEEVKTAGERASNLTRQLLAFSRRQAIQPRVIDLGELADNLTKLLRRLIGENIELAVLAAPHLWPVKADPGQVEQVLVNLAVNARDAMPEGGKLTIEIANTALDQEYAQAHADVSPGEYVALSVSDTGSGMTDEVKAHLFEPFFTTKSQGTGLGLATCYGIVKQSGGHISAYSEPGRGTTMKCYLPRTSAGTEQAAADRSPVPAAQGQETILVVEDDPAVRALAATVLRQLGYAVLEAPDGANALRLVQDGSTPGIDLVLTDVVMPQMGGKDLAERLRKLHPNLKVLFMSGYADGAIAHGGLLDPGTAFLQKPFIRSDLAQKVRETLGQ